MKKYQNRDVCFLKVSLNSPPKNQTKKFHTVVKIHLMGTFGYPSIDLMDLLHLTIYR